jgi:uncharacterized membrane protein
MAERSSTPSSTQSSTGSTQQTASSPPSRSTAPSTQSTEETVFKAVDELVEQLYTQFSKLENSPELADTLSIVTMLKDRMVIMQAQSDAKKAVTESDITHSDEESSKE